ncbi:hypothetical protein M569_02574 [Genlisea aurea]|uniref:Uncharacterized protein n=1 Tax=Genlisea aurea TaxID=192259 RepID=S8EHL4_9LAMI|nr:hypothetical protein M569_02574 [Genlisea aurea]
MAKSIEPPIFPFGDGGFQAQIHCIQAVEEARRLRKRLWWRGAFFRFFKKLNSRTAASRRKQERRRVVVGPVYGTDVWTRSLPCTESRAVCGPLDCDVPYVRLDVMEMERGARRRISAAALPIYLVT